jgi:FkbM family methyltransferase
MPSGVEKLRDFALCAATLGSGPAAKCEILWRETKNLRVRLGVATHRPERVFHLDTRYGVLHFRDNFGDITNLPNLLYRQVYALPDPGEPGDVLDVGANIGLAAVWFRHRFPGRRIHCFEPLADNVRMIRLNCPEARVRQVAVGAARARATLSADPDRIMASSIPCRWDTEAVEVDVLPLDEYVEAERIERIAVLKIDTEGMELDVLAGAHRTLDATRQAILETHGEERHREVVAVLESAGFRIRAQEFGPETGMVFAARDR